MKIGLLPVDGHNFPNLALMKLSSWHKSQGDQVELAEPMFGVYDTVYKSKVFTFTPDDLNVWGNAEIIKAGTGYNDYKTVLPDHIEHVCPDYSLFNSEHAYGFLTRGCSNKCRWCVVPKKEGGIRPASDIEEFIGDKKSAVLLDNNVLAHDFGLQQIEKIIEKKIKIDFNQGLDARKIANDAYVLDLLSRVKWIQFLRMACDTKSQLDPVIKSIEGLIERGVHPQRIFVYTLVEDIQDALDRINCLRKLGVKPFAQPYRDFENKIIPTTEQKQLSWWVNQKHIFYSMDFETFKKQIKQR